MPEGADCNTKNMVVHHSHSSSIDAFLTVMKVKTVIFKKETDSPFVTSTCLVS